MRIQQQVSSKNWGKYIGREVDVLCFSPSDKEGYQVMGRLAEQAPEVDGVVYIKDKIKDLGVIKKVKIDAASDYDLSGSVA